MINFTFWDKLRGLFLFLVLPGTLLSCLKWNSSLREDSSEIIECRFLLEESVSIELAPPSAIEEEEGDEEEVAGSTMAQALALS